LGAFIMAPLGASQEANAHEADLKRMLGDLGYEASSIPEGLAVIRGKMENSNGWALARSIQRHEEL